MLSDSAHPEKHQTVVYEDFTEHPRSPSFEGKARSLAECYQWVYGTDPAWQEGKKCPRCSKDGAPKKWSIVTAPPRCPKCNSSLVDFWPIKVILEDMRDELSKPHAVCAVARTQDMVVGVCWGYSCTPEELEIKLNANLPHEVGVHGVAKTLRKRYPGIERVAYQDEIFVRPEFQGRGIGKHLFYVRHNAFTNAGLRVTTLRTKTCPPSASYHWFYLQPRWAYEIIGRYQDADGRVVLAQHFDRIPPQ